MAPAVGKEAMRRRPAAHSRDRGHVGLGRLQPGEDPVRVLDERGAGRGRADAPAVALDQGDARLVLEPCDGLRDRRLRVGECLGRG